MAGSDATGRTVAREDGMGLRDRKKNEKIHAIRAAARHLFTTKGYEATTLREVAQLADVGFGTVFSYSKDKSGLLSMLIVDDLRYLPPPFSDTIGVADLLEQLTDAFLVIYRFWARSPELSRIVLPQMEYPRANPFATIIKDRGEQTKSEVGAWFARCQVQGRLRADVDVTQAAETVFAIFTSCLRDWIGSDPLDLQVARERLHRLLHLPMSAVCADASAAALAPAARKRVRRA